MKALKEKRISFRSLWRMGLVVLSVLALAFAACGESESGSNTGPGNGSGVNPQQPVGKAPRSIMVLEPPITSGGPVYEGRDVSLLGLKLAVTWENGETETVSFGAGNDIKIDPPIYDFRRVPYSAAADQVYGEIAQRSFIPDSQGGYYGWGTDDQDFERDLGAATQAVIDAFEEIEDYYTITYTSGGKSATTKIHSGLLGAHKRIIDLVYTSNMTKRTYYIDDEPEFAGSVVSAYYASDNLEKNSQGDYENLRIILDVKNDWLKWAWVWNTTPGGGSYATDDNPGVLVSIGSFGLIESHIVGVAGQYVQSSLVGARFPVSKIYQVKKIAWATEPKFENTIFYDNPRLIGEVDDWYEWYMRWALDEFGDGVLAIYYNDTPSGATNTIPANTFEVWELLLQRSEFNELLINGGEHPGQYGKGLAYSTEGGTWGMLDFWPVYPASRSENRFIGNFEHSDVDQDEPDYLIAGWAEWASQNARPKMRFTYRGVSIEGDYPIPVFNRPVGIDVTPRFGTAVEMSGENRVYNGGGEGFYQFLSKLNVTVRYRENVDTAGTNIKSKNILATLGTTTRSIFYYDPGYNGVLGTGSTFGGLVPTLRVTNVYIPTEEVLAAGGWAAGSYSDLAESLLTVEESVRAGTRNARVEYTGWAGYPEVGTAGTRTVNSNVPISISGYTYSYENTPPDFEQF